MVDNISCPNCGKVTPSASFCKYCGGALPKCPSCGGRLSSDAKFCQYCGKPLYVCSSCGEKLPLDAKFCPGCGAEASKTARNEAKPTTSSKVLEEAHATFGRSIVPKDILIEGEVPLFETRPVLWLKLRAPIAFIILGIGILAAIYAVLHKSPILYALGGVLFLGMVWAILTWLQWKHIVFAATNVRIMRQTGILFRSYVDCPLRGIRAISMDISLWGRMNHFGTLHVVGSGIEMDWETIHEPREAHRQIMQIVEDYMRGVDLSDQCEA